MYCNVDTATKVIDEENKNLYWENKLMGLSRMRLLVDYSDPCSLKQKNGCFVKTVIEEDLFELLKQSNRANQVCVIDRLFMALLLLFYKYDHQEDITLGLMHVTNRPDTNEDAVAGFSLPLPIRVSLSGNPTIHELLIRVKKTIDEAFVYQKYLSHYLKELSPEKKPELCQEIYNIPIYYYKKNDESPLADGISFIDQKTLNGFELAFGFQENNHGIEMQIHYNNYLFNESTIKRMAGHFNTLVKTMVTEPERAIQSISVLTEQEYKEIVYDWNDTDYVFKEQYTLNEMFEKQTMKTPDHVAVVFKNEDMTYQQLNKNANHLAHRLIAMGINENKMVGILMNRSFEMVIAMIAVLKTGAAYVPLDPDYPEDRVLFMVEDSGMNAVVTQACTDFPLKSLSVPVMTLQYDKEMESRYDNNIGIRFSDESTAYVIYTSGTTGTPKGIKIPHRAICNHMLWMNETFNYSENDAVLQKAPFSFDAAAWEFYAPLLVGGRLILMEPKAHKDGMAVLSLIKKQKVSVLQGIPSFFRILSDSGRLKECKELRLLFSGAEVMPKNLSEKLIEEINGELYNVYGPAETCIQTLYWRCRKNEPGHEIPAGKPIINSKVYILDPYGHPTPVGVTGEIYIGGKPVANGYINRDKLTSKKFLNNPFIPGGRYYRTGDLGKWNEDGAVIFCGRKDSQVKISGHRVELREIETVLEQYNAVKVAIVAVKNGTNKKNKINAFIIPYDKKTQQQEIKAYLKTRLPHYMIPSRIVFIDKIPFRENGKIDFKTLETLDEKSLPDNHDKSTTPTDDIEKIILDTWVKVLDNERIGTDDNFYELGGDSLNIMEIQIAASKAGISFTADMLLKNPTIKELSKAIILKNDNP